MNNDLIDHKSRWLKTSRNLTYEQWLEDELTAALSPVLPEEVQRELNYLLGQGDKASAEVLERLAREKQRIALQAVSDFGQYQDWMEEKAELQQRIEELEGEFETVLAGRGDTATRLLDQIVEYEKALDPELIGHMKMCIRMKLRKDQKQPDIAKDRIERGEKALKSCKTLERIRGMK